MSQGFTREGISNITSPTGAFSNLKVVRPSVTTVTVTTDELVVRDTGGNATLLTAISETADITASGAGGLDTGAEASDTWYYIWIIRNSSVGTVDILLSISATVPTLPAGFNQKALVSAARNNSSSDFVDFIQEGDIYDWTAWILVATGTILSSPWLAVDISGQIASSISNRVFGSGEDSAGLFIAVTNDNTVADSSTRDRNKMYFALGAGSMQFQFNFILLTTDTIFWVGDGVGVSDLRIAGFMVNKLS